MEWTREKLIEKYVTFFESKEHKEIPSASLIPENDPTVLFTTAGMHPLVPYLTGTKHPLGERLVNVQKCIRTQDIEEVGDAVHHTFFEMLGNWSLGNYWKKEALAWTYEFFTKYVGIPHDKLAVSVFGGDDRVSEIPQDDESAAIWKEIGFSDKRIAYLKGGVFESENNWWGPAGESGPCGPDSEIFYWSGEGDAPEEFDPEDKQWVEIGNNVLMQYVKSKEGEYKLSDQKNVDFGGGVDRTVAALNGLKDNYLAPHFYPIIQRIEELSGKKYEGNEKAMRVIADHIRAAVMIMGDVRGIMPGNTGQGYVLRRLIRRAIRYARGLDILADFTSYVGELVLDMYSDSYPELNQNRKRVLEGLAEEEKKFSKTLDKGLKKFNEISSDDKISGEEAFLLFQSYGFPIEMTQELAKEKGVSVDLAGFEEELAKHQELSRTASAGVFKSGLADNSERTTRLHTATHLLNEALRVVLGSEVKQRGSNINPDRLRFDFSFDRKLTDEEKQKIEDLVNAKVEAGLEVTTDEMSQEEAMKSGAQAEFGAKYPDVVSVYTIVDSSDEKGWFSKEICTGPHVKNTSEVGKFKILKEESSSAGVRRIKATVE